MKQGENIRSQKERQARGPEYDRLEVSIGKWINVGKTEPMGDELPLDITTGDIYEWLPRKYWLLHTAYGRLGSRVRCAAKFPRRGSHWRRLQVMLSPAKLDARVGAIYEKARRGGICVCID